MIEPINIDHKLSLFHDHWCPKIIAELNGQHVKLAKLKGEFVWHSHENEDEMFLVISGSLKIEFRDRVETLNPGELIVIPKGVEHRPVAESEVSVMLFEPKSTINTGDAQTSNLTRNKLDKL
jgi:mannose-6-phosphate isomerase-like protein (cupin superfamily)